MINIPSRGSPSCVLIVASLLLGFLGVGLTFATVSSLLAADGDPLENVVFIGVPGVACLILAVGTGTAAFKKPDAPQGLFSSGVNPMELASRAKTKDERELADEAVTEATRQTNQLTPNDRRVLDQAKSTILAALSHDEAVLILSERSNGEIVLANPMLQPIAFAMKPTTTLRYVKGIVLEILTWVGVVIAIPFILIFDVWEGGKAVLYKALRLSRRARQYRVRPHNVFQRDNRAPILYLRSFSDDYEESSESFLPTTSEEKLVSSYSRYGPMIAIGKPTEKLPLLGASRIYFDDSAWQAGVLYLMSVSQRVIIQAGIAPGLLWELGVARQRLEPQRLIISFTAWEELDEWTRHLHYLRFKKYAEELLGCELPLDIKATSHIAFEEGWAPVPQSDFSYSLPSVRERRSKVKRLVGGALAIACALLAAFLVPPALKKVVELTGVTTYKEDSARWKHYTLGSTGMSVDLPDKPNPVDVPVIAFGLREQSMFVYDGGDLDASMGHARYSDIVEVSGEESLKGAVDGIRRAEGVSDVSYSTQQVGDGKLALDGRFILDGKEYKLRGYSLVKDHDAWFICVFYNSGNNAAGLAAQRMLNSVKFGG